jgi:hypothetical protein
VLLLAKDEVLDLSFLRDQVRASVRSTFGYSIYQDLWKLVDHTANKQEEITVIENLFRFSHKQCSNPLDMVYSILSISTDGAKLQVDYKNPAYISGPERNGACALL